MPANLPRLVNASDRVAVQETDFTRDVLARYVCSTLDEALTNPNFDAIVIGSGMYGGYCAERLFRIGTAKGLRVLVLEAGAFLAATHLQNLPRFGLYEPAALDAWHDPGTPRNEVWGLPYRSNEPYVGLAYCLGGKSLYWGGWCPRLTDHDLLQWPTEVADYLRANYPQIERLTGTAEQTDFVQGPLYDALLARCQTVVAGGTLPHLQSVHAPPLAVLGSAPASGLFSFDKFSSASLLIDAVRQDVRESGANDANRRLFVVPRAHVTQLMLAGDRVSGIEVAVGATRRTIPVSADCDVVLAASAIESTRLALEAFPRSQDPATELMGRNLMVHLRSNLTVRIRRSALETATHPLPHVLQTAALLIRGSTAQGAFHLQLTAAADPNGNSDDLLFAMIPDIDLLEEILATQKADMITLTVRGVAEMQGHKATPIHAPNRSWMDLSPFERDEFSQRRAFAFLKTTPDDDTLWNDMDRAARALAEALGAAPTDVEMVSFHRDGLGTTYHEAGTLWMGDDPATSVTNVDGRFHHIMNAYCADQALFPTVGSVNPVLTGLTLARKVAEEILARH